MERADRNYYLRGMNFNSVTSYISYIWFAKSRYTIHSPFIYRVIENVFRRPISREKRSSILAAHKALKQNRTEITIEDLGAVKGKKIKRISTVAKYSVIPKKYGKILSNLVEEFQCKTVLELGTSLGISGLYLALDQNIERFITIEGCPTVAAIAAQQFEALKLKKAEIVVGDFDQKLPEVLSKINTLDLAYFDGNHTKEATLRYFNQCLPLAHNNTVFIFDDIHWSEGMEEAWEEIKSNEHVVVSIDINRMGFLFFRKESSREHFTIRV